jgi:hypothetical protein
MGGLPTFKHGILRRFEMQDNGKGTMTKVPVEAPVCVQVDALTQAQLAEGYAEDDVRLIIIAAGLDQYLQEPRVKDSDELEMVEDGVFYRIAAPTLDPLKSNWSCRGRIKPVSLS